MMDFKVLVKVNADDPENTLATLGEKVTGDVKAFSSVDRTWLLQQEFITAVPVEIALTVEMRAVVQANSPETRFIVTGVTGANVKRLVEDFGYVVSSSVKDLDKKIQTNEEKKEALIKAGANNAVSTSDPEIKAVYRYNGKEVSEEEWEKRRKEILSKMSDVFGQLVEWLD